MNFNVEKRVILKVRHGSHAYGTNTPESDLDIKAVAIEPLKYHLGFLNVFEQYELMASKSGGIDSVTYSLKKFAKLAADCNPNIIEILYVSDDDILFCDKYGERLLLLRDEFLSKRVKFTFSGYMMSQVKRIKTHRKWLLDPPSAPPNRADFGINVEISDSDVGAFDAMVRQNDTEDQMLRTFNTMRQLPTNVIELFTREKKYRSAKNNWDQYVSWKKSRNPVRAELETKYGYDTKHAHHVVRLGRMCVEMLSGKGVIVKRPDKEELIAIRYGVWSYDRLVDESEKLNVLTDKLYETSTLRHQADKVKIDNEICHMTLAYTNNDMICEDDK